MYIVSNIEGEFVTKLLVTNSEETAQCYIELYDYGCDIENDTRFFEFEKYPGKDDVIKAIDEYWSAHNGADLPRNYKSNYYYSFHDFETDEQIYFSKEEEEDLCVQEIIDIRIELESYEVWREDEQISTTVRCQGDLGITELTMPYRSVSICRESSLTPGSSHTFAKALASKGSGTRRVWGLGLAPCSKFGGLHLFKGA